jgi:hypothetical protein
MGQLRRTPTSEWAITEDWIRYALLVGREVDTFGGRKKRIVASCVRCWGFSALPPRLEKLMNKNDALSF